MSVFWGGTKENEWISSRKNQRDSLKADAEILFKFEQIDIKENESDKRVN